MKGKQHKATRFWQKAQREPTSNERRGDQGIYTREVKLQPKRSSGGAHEDEEEAHHTGKQCVLSLITWPGEPSEGARRGKHPGAWEQEWRGK